MDGTFTYDKKYLQDFCNSMIAEQININWRCTARYDNLDSDLMKLLREANCVGFYFGLESGSDRILKAVQKKTTVEEIIKISAMAYDSGFYLATSVILGLPDETKEDIEKTLKLMKTVKTNVFDVNSYVPLPGTPIYNSMDKVSRQNVDWEKVAMKSLDNHFSKTMSRDEFRGYLLQAYEIADLAWQKSLTSGRK